MPEVPRAVDGQWTACGGCDPSARPPGCPRARLDNSEVRALPGADPGVAHTSLENPVVRALTGTDHQVFHMPTAPATAGFSLGSDARRFRRPRPPRLRPRGILLGSKSGGSRDHAHRTDVAAGCVSVPGN